jgi:hypothetical protein
LEAVVVLELVVAVFVPVELLEDLLVVVVAVLVVVLLGGVGGTDATVKGGDAAPAPGLGTNGTPSIGNV